jgi:hypothetical protein
LETAAFNTNFIHEFLCVFNSSSCIQITFQVMAVAFQSTSYHYAVGTIFKATQDI